MNKSFVVRELGMGRLRNIFYVLCLTKKNPSGLWQPSITREGV